MVSRLLAYLTLHRFSLTVDDRIRGHDAVRSRVRLNHLELNCSHAASHKEDVAFVNRTVCLQEVRLQVHLKKVTRKHRIKVLLKQEEISPAIEMIK